MSQNETVLDIEKVIGEITHEEAFELRLYGETERALRAEIELNAVKKGIAWDELSKRYRLLPGDQVDFLTRKITRIPRPTTTPEQP